MLRKYKAKHLGRSATGLSVDAWDRLFYMRVAQVYRSSCVLYCTRLKCLECRRLASIDQLNFPPGGVGTFHRIYRF